MISDLGLRYDACSFSSPSHMAEMYNVGLEPQTCHPHILSVVSISAISLN